MESWKELAAFVLEREGGYVNNKADKGGPTNKGVTLATYRSVYGQHKTVEDLKRITDAEWEYIFKKFYWDKCKADYIQPIISQRLPNPGGLYSYWQGNGFPYLIKKVTHTGHFDN
jgi:lysozyme family protein